MLLFVSAVVGFTGFTQPSGLTTPESVREALPKLDAYVKSAMEKTRVPGVAVVVVYRDEIVWLKGYGVREVGKDAAVSENTVFQLASMSKPISATVVASLVGKKVVSWDSKVSNLMPEFQMNDPYPSREVTVRDFFCHRSGLPGDAGNDLEMTGIDQAEILRRLRYVPAASSFRSAYSYSNFGITTGAVAAAKPTGLDWPSLAERELFKPLGMASTSYRYADLLKHDNRATLHALEGGAWRALARREPDAQAPAGGASSTARDLAQWLRLELGGGIQGGKRWIDEAALSETHMPQIHRGADPITGNASFYGLGWNVEYEPNGQVRWGHAGAFSQGARTLVTLLPQEQLGIIVLCNAFPTGLPEAVSAQFIDDAQRSKKTTDWLARWTALYDTFTKMMNAQAERYTKAPTSPLSSAPLSAYVGRYAGEYLGEVEVVERGGKLAVRYPVSGKEYVLRHFNRDVFVYAPYAESPNVDYGVTFTLDSNGKAATLQLEDHELPGTVPLKRVSNRSKRHNGLHARATDAQPGRDPRRDRSHRQRPRAIAQRKGVPGAGSRESQGPRSEAVLHSRARAGDL
ncbi:MAG TPA: serine hydrolase [Fimbriimonadaceae bacterium]|nr:serine hydrolase [Fimbriimonadaceae bacterium]